MINSDTQLVFELSDYFHQLGNAFGEFIQRHKFALTDDERNELFDKQIQLLQISAKINMTGVTLILADVQNSINELDRLTSDVKKTIRKALAVQDAINLAAAATSVGTAIISGNLQSFIKSTGELKAALDDIRDKRI